MKKGWKIKKLEEVCEKIFAGGDKPKEFSKFMTDEFSVPIFANGEKNKGLYGYTNVARISKPSITISGRGTIGYSEIRTQPFVPIVRLITLLPNEETVDINFLHYGLKNLNFSNSGSSIPQLTVPMVKGYSIPFPKSLPEQKRIVSILDKAFAEIAKAKANAKQNLKNAKELFESYLQGVFEGKGEGWEEKKLDEIVSKTCNLSYGVVQPGNDFENGLPVVRPVDLKSKFVKKDRVKLMNPINAEKYKRTTLQGNELLLCVRGDTGIISLITNEFKGANVTRGIVPVSFDDNQISLQFGYYSFISPFVQKQIKDKTYGAALMQINIRDVRQLLMLIPPITEQKQIVQKLDNLSSETKKLELVYKQKLEDLEELKKSVLQKAFNGEL